MSEIVISWDGDRSGSVIFSLMGSTGRQCLFGLWLSYKPPPRQSLVHASLWCRAEQGLSLLFQRVTTYLEEAERSCTPSAPLHCTVRLLPARSYIRCTRDIGLTLPSFGRVACHILVSDIWMIDF
jgi:hypothetical protein